MRADLRHCVQMRAVFTEPRSLMRTERKFGSQRRRVLRIEWLTLFPEAGPFPHASHRLATEPGFLHLTDNPGMIP